jgi:pimeloyl-ACP methyl ester carboxylesterase
VSDGPFVPRPVTVRGGAFGVDADCEDLCAVARVFGALATHTADLSARVHGYLLDPALDGSALLDPVGGSRVVAELTVALDGPNGVTWLSGECGALDLALRAAAAAYREADRVASDVRLVVGGVTRLPEAAAAGAVSLVRTGEVGRAITEFAARDPALADDLVDAATAATGRAGRRVVEEVFSDGRPEVRDLGIARGPETPPPRSTRGLLAGLADCDDGPHGQIDIRFLNRPGGHRAVVVDLPGTKNFDPRWTPDITNFFRSDIRAVYGEATSYEQGVFAAMRQAGVRADDDVMLVGHSEGGMVAVRAAMDAHARRNFRITHVVTAGAPIGRFAAAVPKSVQVLAIENKPDVVPHLDGMTNAPASNVTTVTVDRPHDRLVDNHLLRTSYLPGAYDVDASDDPSVRAFIDSAAAYFDATSMSTHRFLLTRRH